MRLLNRTTRSVTPTEAGERLLERLVPALGEVGAALDAVNLFRDSPAGTLRLNVATVVARVVLPPLVTRFLAQHPGIVLEVTADDSFIDVLAAGFDAGVRYGERLERDMIAVPIGPREQRFVTAGAPSYFAAHGRPAHPRDVLDHACIRHRFASGATPSWEFERGGEVIKVVPQGPLIATSGELEIAAAIHGLGLIRTFDGFVAEACGRRQAGAGAGRLVAAISRAVSLLCEPPAYARAVAGIRRFPQAREPLVASGGLRGSAAATWRHAAFGRLHFVDTKPATAMCREPSSQASAPQPRTGERP